MMLKEHTNTGRTKFQTHKPFPPGQYSFDRKANWSWKSPGFSAQLGNALQKSSLYETSIKKMWFCHLGDGLNITNFIAVICYMWRNNWIDVCRSLSDLEQPNLPIHVTPAHIKFTMHVLSRAKISSAVMMVALLYIWRYRNNCTNKKEGQPTSEVRIMVCALMVACKYVDDMSYTSASWGSFTDIKASELSKMELEFLDGLNYNLHVSHEDWVIFSSFAQNNFISKLKIPMY